MIDDIIEGTVKGFLKSAFRLVFQLIVEVLFFYTGEIVVFLVTLGKRKPRWNYYSDGSASRFVIFTEASTWIGFAFWLFVAWFINNILLN